MLVITLQRQLLVEVKSNQSSFLQFSCSLLTGYHQEFRSHGPGAQLVVPAQADWKGEWAG